MLDYDGTREDWAAHVKTLLAAQRMGEHLRRQIREAAAGLYRADWGMLRTAGLDRAFLAWLGSPNESWLEAPVSRDHYLPATVMGDTVSGGQALANRDKRVAQCAEALMDWGWPEDDALCFVASKEEWAAAKRQAGP